MSTVLLHLIDRDGWNVALAAGVIAPPSLAEVGFVHLSTPDQVVLPADRLFAGRPDVLLLVLDPARIGVDIRWEPGVHGDPATMRFPHAYGPVPASAVRAVLDYRPGADGRFADPELPNSLDRSPPAVDGHVDDVPERQVRALFDEQTLTVYQAFRPEIADPALTAGTFVAPFKTDRMTWIKPSFLWMMYRCGWAEKAGQERVLAIRVWRDEFDRALTGSCLSHFRPELHADHDSWRERLAASPVRVQWDPERNLQMDRLPWRTIQVGLSGSSVAAYLATWIAGITDVTPLARQIHELLAAGAQDDAARLLPTETPYPLPAAAAREIGAG